jgi:hypothetical protein
MVGTVIAKVAGSALGATYTMPAADGAAGTYLKTDGSTNLSFGAIAAAGFDRVTYITATDTTWDFQSTTTKAIIEVQASGGTAGSQDSPGYNGGGGGAGAYARKTLTGLTGSTDKLNITIGAVVGIGATGSTTSVAQAGTASFTTITCDGGDGGVTATGTAQAGGVGGAVPTTGDFNIAGGNGCGGQLATAPGGQSFLGIGNYKNSSAAGAGPAPCGYGSGGTGAAGSGGHLGGAGGPAIVIIWEFV